MRRTRRAQVVAQVPAPYPVPASAAMPPPWPGLFMGATVDRQPAYAGPQQCLLVLGPPRSGKTTSVVVPNLLTAPGAVVATSTKTEIVGWSAPVRALRGNLWLFDPSGTTPISDGLVALHWSPVSGCERWEVAVARAHALASAAQPRSGNAYDHWTERAETLLAPLLHAAALAGRNMASVLRWVQRRDVQEAIDLSAASGAHEVAADSVQGILETEERERSGIFSTAANILSAYRMPAALERANDPNFDPEAFVRSSDTIYICAPATEQAQLAPLVVAFLETVRRAAYARGGGWPPVEFLLDEVANIAPLPGLPALVSEGASQGVVTLACLQDLSQARARWGVAADGFLTLFGAKLVLPGIADLHTLQLVSALAGDEYVMMKSQTSANSLAAMLTRDRFIPSSTTRYLERRPALPVDMVARAAPGAAIAIWAGAAPTAIGMVPAWQEPWQGILRRAHELARSKPSATLGT